MTVQVGVLFKYDFTDPSNSLQTQPSANKVLFQVGFFSLRTCSNSLAYMNSTSYQCTTQVIHTCSP
jgi:hypothetical protein